MMSVPHRVQRSSSAALALAIIGGFAGGARGADVLWDAGGPLYTTTARLWTVPENWAGDVVPGPNDTAVFGPGADIAGTVTISAAGTPSGPRIVDGVRFTSTEHLYTLSSGVIQLNRVELLGDASAISNTGHVISGTLTTAGSNITLLTQNNNGAIPLNLNGAIGLGGGPAQVFAVTKNGSGAAYLRATNLYTLGTIINAGTFELRGTLGRVPLGSHFDIAKDATLSLRGVEGNNNSRISDTAAINLAGGTFSIQGAADVATSERVGAISLNDGTSRFNLAHGGTSTGTATLRAASITRNNRATADFTGTSLGLGLSSLGTRFDVDGPVTMVGSNTTGSSTTLAVVPWASSGKFGVMYDTTLTPDGGRIGFRPLRSHEYENFFTTVMNPAANVLVNNFQSMGGSTSINSLVLDAGGVLSGSFILGVNSGSVHGAGGQMTASGLSFGSVEGIFHAASGNTTINAAVQGINGITKGGPGEITLGGNNTYSGPTTINEGTLTFKHASALPSGSGDVTVYAGGATPTRLQFLASFVGETTRQHANPIHLRGTGTVAISHDLASVVSVQPGNLTLSGPIDGTAMLLLDGGPVTLSGDNSYSGGTRMAGSGGVRLGHDHALGTGPLTIAAGSTGSIRVAGGPAPISRVVANDVISEGGLILAGPGALTLSGNVSAVVRDIQVTGTTATNPVTLAGTLTSSAAGPWSMHNGNSSPSGQVGALRLATTTPVQGGFNVKAGVLVLGANALDGDIRLGNTSGFLTATLLSDVSQTIDNDVTVEAGNTGTATLGARHTSGTTTYAGTITLGSAPAGTPATHHATIAAGTGGVVSIAGTLQDVDATTAASVTVGGGSANMRGLVRFDNPTGITYKGATIVSFADLLIAPGTTMASKTYSAGFGALTIEGEIPDDSTITVPGNVNDGVVNFTKTEMIASLSLASNGVANVAAGGDKTFVTGALAVTQASQLRMNDNDMIVDYAEGATSPEFTLRDHAITARDGATTGISFTETPGDDMILAFGEASELVIEEFNGFAVDDTTVVGKYTYYGDANLDGQVTTDDYVAVDLGLGTGDSWVQGDFDLNGVVTTDDYVAVDLNLGKGTSNPLAYAEEQAVRIALHTEMFGQSYVEKLSYASEHGWVAASVPEPSTIGALSITCAVLTRRRRKNR